MKKIYYFLVVFILCIEANSQTVPAGENISLDEQLSNINQSSVTSGIIYERVVPIANIYNFNTVSTFNTANFNYFQQALDEMNRASNGTKFTTLDNFRSLIATTTDESQVDLSILNTQYHILNYNEDYPSQGGLTFNTSTYKFVQISGVAPFYMLNTSIISPTKDYVSGPSVTYKIRNDLYFKNGTKNIKTLVANFGDGINRTLISTQVLTNQNIVVNYPSSGEKIITFTITYSDETTLTTYGRIYFELKQTALLKDFPTCSGDTNTQDVTGFQSDIPFTGYVTGDPTIKAKIDYRVYYANANSDKKIRKPIIIIDGFDPGDKRKIDDCDCENNTDCASKNTTNGVFDPMKHKSMVDMMQYYDPSTQQTVKLLPELRALGYDIIMVNHPKYSAINTQNGQSVVIDGGAYYIESNAYALVKLLTETKTKLVENGSTNNIAVIGPSMGGQISRYALAYMEKNNIPHNTYLWVSIDSPHLGANIPLGDQALLNLVKGSSHEAKTFYEKDLSSPAAQQQLIEFHKEVIGNYHLVNQNLLNAQTTSQGMPNNRGNSIFQQHYNTQFANGIPNSKGWPMNLRKVALVNGSLSGSKQTMTSKGEPSYTFANDNEKVLNLRGFQRVNISTPLGSITFRIHIASLEANFLPSSGSADTKIARFKKLWTDRTTKSPNYNTRGNMDNVPGGFFGAQDEIASPTQNTNPVPGTTLLSNWSVSNLSLTNLFYSVSQLLGGSEWYLHEFNPIHSFIPTFSALGYLQPNQTWAIPLDTNLKCPTNNMTPFDSYFGEAKNTQHTSFTKESKDWLLKELAGQPQAPHFPIQANLLSGLSSVCLNINSTYSFNDSCKVPSAVTWTVSSNMQIVSSTAYSITIKGISNGLGTITATFQNGQKVIKNVYLGKPVFSIQKTNDYCEAGKHFVIYKIIEPQNFSFNYQLIYPTSQGGTASLNGTTITIYFASGYFNPGLIISVKGTNSCGNQTFFLEDEVVQPCGSAKMSNNNLASSVFKIYPNPSNDLVYIDLRDENNQPTKDDVISAQLFNIIGQSSGMVDITENKAIVDVKRLKKGIYVLKISINGKIESHQIAVK